MKPNDKKPDKRDPKEEEFPGYPLYPDNEDIYRQEHEEKDIDPETLAKKNNPQKLGEHSMDVPGSEDDDADEAIGNEDEENNYYSLGGENHEDLEENREDLS
jgi:hypothetical protein